jgi:proline iminopeptidase
MSNLDKRMVDGEFFIPLNGIRHWCKVAGRENRATVPVVVIHGGPGGNNYTFERTIGPRLERFATVIYYEQRGCGRSEAPNNSDDYTIPLLLADLDALRAAFALEKISLLGYSFGGYLALEYAIACPNRIAQVIVQSPGLGNDPRGALVQLAGFELVATGDIYRHVRSVIEGQGTADERLAKVWEIVDSATVDRFLFHNPDRARVNRQLWEESGLLNSGQMARTLAKQPLPTLPLRHRLPLLHVPTLVLVGLYDRNSGVDVNRDVASLIPGAILALFEGSAHFPDMEEPERYASIVQKFLS